MEKNNPNFAKYREKYQQIRSNLEIIDYENFIEYYEKNGIESDIHYVNILRAGIKRPKCFLRRQPKEKWINQYNPFVLSFAKSNCDLQLILEEYTCAQYVVEYVNKTNRGLSNLQRQIINIMDENPELGLVEITRQIGLDLLNHVEMSSQEAAWFLLGQLMSQSSEIIVSIPTVWPEERERIKKTKKEMDKLGIGKDSTNIWKDNWIDKYERRTDDLKDVTLAQFVARYNIEKGKYVLRKVKSYHTMDSL